ncbi:polygalacturonase inhibitor-like [Triticum dicoccoides]|uniref:polygalacturonase inhibitor-like n=1 Tax=Triticum dicoccoides TaxID=85692 RepID=UPI0018905A52|nr:polygalacturonase inhibitor-like [Triticum dicoccoides]
MLSKWSECSADRMRMYSHALLVLLLCSLLAGAANAEPSRELTYKDCHPDDKAVLLAFPESWSSSWAPDTPCCDWFAVACARSTARVVGFSVFQDPNFTGTIPSAIAGLTHLEDLFLHHLPGLSGPIPSAIGKLTNLSRLEILWTAVSGPVPSSLGKLKKLTQLDLSFNSLSGAIPVTLGAIPGITLSRNRLTGAIPQMFLSESAGQDVYLDVSHNNLTGPIPASFAAVNFTHLDLSRNALTGDASGLFGRGKELQYINLSRNAFDFYLSGVVVLPEKLFHLDMSHNAIQGSIPAQVANVANLLAFNVRYNRLCGPVPAGGNMARFDLYSFQHNKCLCGAPLPPCKK